jgi:hypothetical protein
MSELSGKPLATAIEVNGRLQESLPPLTALAGVQASACPHRLKAGPPETWRQLLNPAPFRRILFKTVITRDA